MGVLRTSREKLHLKSKVEVKMELPNGGHVMENRDLVLIDTLVK